MKTKWFMVIPMLLLALLCGCREEAAYPTGTAPTVNGEAPLIAQADTLEDAQAIADQYGITLVEYDLGVATFYTEEDPQTVIDRGIRNGWPVLELNRKAKSY